ncbi:hypothetical protein niasHT_014348 [Heterodera trifolii]|uniref:Uncharacterized protein n=1 Tax=Heterodera trifolii TaxID=157864 RepID=A0ABD2LH70_9BILA
MSDNRKEAAEKMAKAIFISGDCWLAVFDLLKPSHLGLGIALISHRFDYYVDEHFKTRKWTLGSIRIKRKIGEENMEIVNYFFQPLPIAKIQLPRKVIRFEHISIYLINCNSIAFLNRFRPLFVSCPINLIINTVDKRFMECILRYIWPMIAKNICGTYLFTGVFHCLRQIAPSLLNECQSLRVVSVYYCGLFPEFPCDDSAMASDGQAVAKWLFIPRPDNVPKVLKCWLDTDDPNLASKLEAFKSAFSNTSASANFIVYIYFIRWHFDDSVVPFDLSNELTREQLVLKRIDNSDRFLLIRCPIARDESKWAEWEEEAIRWQFCDQWNQIEIQINSQNDIGDE